MVQVDEGIILILCSSLLASSAYALIAPFFPLELEDKGVDEKYIGMIFSIYSFAIIIFSPPVGRYLELVGYTNMLVSGLALMGATFMAFGSIEHFESADSVLYMSLFLRFMQGTAVAMTYTTIYAIISNNYPEKKAALLGMLEASFGVGLIFGPLAGSSLFDIFGFAYTFYIYGGAFLVFTILLYFCLPTIPQGVPTTDPRVINSADVGGSSNIKRVRLDSSSDVDVISSSSSLAELHEKCTFLDLLGDRGFFLAACAGAMSQFIYSYMEPILAKTLEDLSLDQIQIGWFFMILPAAYIPSAIFLDFVPKQWDKRIVIMFGLLFCSIALIFVGPSSMLNVHENQMPVMIFG